MDKTSERKGPKGYRFLVMTLNILLGLLIYWLLGFLIDDIGDHPGPSLTELQQQYQNQDLVKKQTSLSARSDKLSKHIDAQRQQLTILQTSISSYRDTMNQLLDLQKSSVQKGITVPPESQKNLKEVTQLYLNYQQQFQNLNQSISKDNLANQALQSQIRDLNTRLTEQGERAYETYESLLTQHNLKMAALKLLVLIPLLFFITYFYRRYRNTIYKPIFTAVGVVVILKIIMVMLEHFPSRLFKYILIVALIYFTARALISMLRMAVAPKLNWLLKQYREAYQKNHCPTCQFSIQPGVLKFCSEQSIQQDSIPNIGYLEHIDAYTCPSCGEQLFEKCNVCSKTRHSLLMYCDHCGSEKKLDLEQKDE